MKDLVYNQGNQKNPAILWNIKSTEIDSVYKLSPF